jgi:tryptophan-rich sensory protein
MTTTIKTNKSVGRQSLALLRWLSLCSSAAATGCLVSIDRWCASLKTPAWDPPGWIVGPVWTVLYFMMAIKATIVAFMRVTKIAILLLVPYLGWVSFAAFLNSKIWQLNA